MVGATIWTIQLPPAPFWQLQSSFEAVLAQVPRIVIASVLAYWSGEFCNSYVLAKSKVRTDGKGMGIRFITSTMAGQAVDTLIFMTIAFAGVYPANEMLMLFATSWVFKVLWEVVALPVSVPFIKWLKASEHEDFFDSETDFNPFRIAVATGQDHQSDGKP